MNKPSFQELQYKQPPIDIAEATQRAIIIVKDLLHTVPSALPYIMEPSAVLLFAGLRAESPYHILGDEVNEDKEKTLDTVLAKHGIYRFCDALPADSAYPNATVFSLINTSVLNTIPHRYGFIKDVWTPLNPDIPFRYAYTEWAFIMERTLVHLMSTKALPKYWLKEWWAPHNLRFGMLLGYPGEAISSWLWENAHHEEGKSDDHPTTEIVIADGKPYFGTHVAFDSSTDTVDNPSIKDTKHTWGKVINQVYDAVPLAELMHNERFAEGYRQLKLRDSGETQ